MYLDCFISVKNVEIGITMKNGEIMKNIDCVRLHDNNRCYFCGGYCSEERMKNCDDYKSDKGLYRCPHCEKNGLKLFDYGRDKVWECLRCGAELWYCESVEEMLERCKEIKPRGTKNVKVSGFEEPAAFSAGPSRPEEKH